MPNKEKMSEGGFLVPGIVERPLNWWEALKERLLPGFLRRWFPIRYESIDLKKLLIEALKENDKA